MGSTPTTWPSRCYLDANFPLYGNGALKQIFRPNIGQWYHIVFGVQAVNPLTGSANWYLYVNGQQMAFSNSMVPGAFYTWQQGAIYPPAVNRPLSYIAKSDWSDNNDQVYLDAFRVYDYLLDNATVQSLAALYGLNQPFPTVSSRLVQNGTEYLTNVATVPTPPIFSANFEANPASYVGPTAYQWLAQDPNEAKPTIIIGPADAQGDCLIVAVTKEPIGQAGQVCAYPDLLA